jgi:hypothetical protein
MSIYAQAIIGVADALTGASANAAFDAAYGKYYSAEMNKSNAARAKVTAEANINAIKQQKIHTDALIEMRQNEAEAEAKVMAAVSGTTGGSVDDVIHQTHVSSSLAKQNVKQNVEQQIENQLSKVYTQQTAMLAEDNVDIDRIDPTANLIRDLSSFTGEEFDSFKSEVGNLAKSISSSFKAPTATAGVNAPIGPIM